MQEIHVKILLICKVGKKSLFNINLHYVEKVFEMIFLLVPGVCSDQKTLHGCGPGSQREKFMKKHCRKTCGLCPMLVLVTGGKEGRRSEGFEDLNSTELLNMDGTWNCPMPTMPEPRLGHTQTGPVVCGGYDGSKSCISFIRGSVNWKKTHTLARRGRVQHSAWASPRGIMLLGGWGSKTSTEILMESGDTNPGFNLDYRTA